MQSLLGAMASDLDRWSWRNYNQVKEIQHALNQLVKEVAELRAKDQAETLETKDKDRASSANLKKKPAARKVRKLRKKSGDQGHTEKNVADSMVHFFRLDCWPFLEHLEWLVNNFFFTTQRIIFPYCWSHYKLISITMAIVLSFFIFIVITIITTNSVTI